TWRLRKQYLNEPQALLTDLSTGKVAARGERAHEQALQLCEGRTAGLLGLFWVGQTQSLDVPVPENECRASLEAALEREISVLAGGALARAVRIKAAAGLEAFLTPKAQRPTGVYKSAMDERTRVEEELDQARRAIREAAERFDQLGRLR